MSIKIVLPDTDGVKSGQGTKVYTEDGTEIKNVTNIAIKVSRKQPITATLNVFVSNIENSDNITPVFNLEYLEHLAEQQGYQLVPKPNVEIYA